MKNIRLQNFRCYTDQSFSFKKGINLLIGDNASGKTSVLKACKYILSAFFSGFSDENTKWMNPDSRDFQQISINGIIAPEQPIHISFDTDFSFSSFQLAQNNLPFILDQELPFTLTKNSKKNSRALIYGIKDYKEFSYNLSKEYFDQKGQKQALPLFASFSTEDIHTNRKIDAGKFKNYDQKPSFGYYECLEGSGFLPYWIKRLLILQEGKKNNDEIEIVKNALTDTLGASGCNIIQDLQIRPIQKKVYYVYMDGREIESDFLSDGYRRLVNIVTDIAFRCALLNRGIFGLNACKQTKGTVLIDEIDLHLHPTLQSSILKSLKQTFQNLQFIVTTHAPMVMTGIENNDENTIHKLSFSKETGYSVSSAVTFGMDVSTITETLLNQTPRDKNVDEELKKLFSLIDQEKETEAKQLLKKMQEKFGDNLPELSRAEAMLNCIF
ncbi:MAG: AAA family ATPase [Paludibacteraceae bacterium]|nr:AAA family ATPase [Paludibacteraceae bacterium]